MRDVSRLVLVGSSLFFFHVPGANARLPADVISNAPGAAKESPAAAEESSTTTKKSGETKAKAAAAPANPVRPAGATGNFAAEDPPTTVKHKLSKAQKQKMIDNKVFRQVMASHDDKVKRRMYTAWARLGPDFVNNEAEMAAIRREMRTSTVAATKEAYNIDPEYEGATQQAGDEFFSEYGKGDENDNIVRPPPPVIAGDGAGTCTSNCAENSNRLTAAIERLNDRIARLEAGPPVPRAVPVGGGGNGIGVGFQIPFGPILAAIFGNGNQRQPPGFFNNPYQRGFPMAGGRFGPGGGFGPGGRFGNRGFPGGGPGFGPGGRGGPGGPAYIPGGGGLAGNGLGNGFGGGFGGNQFGNGLAGGYGGQAGSPGVIRGGGINGQGSYGGYNTGAGVLYNNSSSALSPLGFGNQPISNSAMMSSTPPRVIFGNGGFA